MKVGDLIYDKWLDRYGVFLGAGAWSGWIAVLVDQEKCQVIPDYWEVVCK